MRVAFLTSHEYPDLTADDRLAVEALRTEGVSVVPLVWGDSIPADLNAVVVRSPWSYYRAKEAFVEWLSVAEASGVPFWNPVSLVRWNLDKKYLLEMDRKGVPIVPTLRFEGDLSQVMKALTEVPWPEYVVKPDVSAGAYRTLRIRAEELLGRKGVIGAILKEGVLLAQPFVESVETDGELSLIYFRSADGTVLSHGLRKRPKAGDFRVQEKFGGSLEVDLGGPEWEETARRALEALPHPWLYARVDMVLFEGRPVLGELEVFEPELFFRLSPPSAALFARCLKSLLPRKNGTVSHEIVH